MDATTKVRATRNILDAFPDYDIRDSMTCSELARLDAVTVEAIRGIVTLDDAPPKPPKPVTCEEFKAAMFGKKIAAIKALRTNHCAGLGLKEAKEAVEEIMSIFADAAVVAREPMPF